MSRNIYTKKQAVCPACRKSYELKYPNPKLYAASSRDDDERVTGYTWTMGIQTDVLPHHYSVLQCPHCLYTDFIERLEKPGYGSKERGIFKAYNELPVDRKAILKTLLQVLPKEQYNLDAAFALHLSAIYISLLPGHEAAIDHLKLGRLYLRLSWLYKEQGSEGFNAANSSGQTAKTSKSSISAKLSQRGEQLEENFQNSLDLLDQFRELAEERTGELDLHPENNPFAKLINTIEDNMERALQDLSKLEHIVVQDRNRILVLKDNKNGAQDTGINAMDTGIDGKENPPTLNTLLPSLVAMWPQLPQSIESTIKLAAEAFEYSFKHEEVSQNIQQSHAVGNIIMQLMHKMGNLDRALDLSVQLYKSAFKDKQSLQMALTQGQNDNSMTDEETKEMNRMITSVTNSLSKSGENRKALLSQIYERDKSKISKLLITRQTLPPEEQVQALIQAGINPEIITYLKDRQIIKVNGTQKKKWFGK
jgi:uncharacterized protein (DUF2225 family)